MTFSGVYQMTTLTINNHYNFSVYANSILGTTYRNARLVSILDYKTALKFSNIVLQHNRVYPYLPANTLEDATKYTYYKFQVGDKEIVLADVWIIDSSIEMSTGTDHTLKLINVSSGQLSTVRDQLRLLGISFTIS